MAVGSSSQSTQDMGAQQPNQEHVRREAPRSSFSLTSGGMFGAPIKRSSGSEDYLKIKEGLKAVFDRQDDKNIEFALLDLDRVNEPALMYSALIVAMRFKDRPAVAYHVLIIEATGDALSPLIETIHNQQIEIMRVTSDALDAKLFQLAEAKVSKYFPNHEIFMSDGCVIPRSFNPMDMSLIDGLALNASWAVGTELVTRDPEFVDLNLATEQADASLSVSVGFTKQQLESAVGLPIRSDVLVNFEAKTKLDRKERGDLVNVGDSERRISELSGFIDLLWNPVVPQNPMNAYQPMMPFQTQKYSPRLVITNLASNHSMTLGSILLALSTAISLNDDNNWIQAFKPSLGGLDKEIDLGDIGALNIEANLQNEAGGFGTRIKTKSVDFGLEDLGQLVTALIQPGLIMSMDVPEVGAQSWYLDVFSLASHGNERAYAKIFDTANRLTNGAFETYFPYGTPMFEDLNNRVHAGYWTDKAGRRRDLRDFDYLAVCNLIGDRSPNLIRDWSDTFLRVQYPLDQRLAARKKMIDSLSGETAVYTGFYHRVTFSKAFIAALTAGIKATQFIVRVNSAMTGSDFSNQRGVATFANAAMMAPGQTYMVPGGFGYQGPSSGYHHRNFRTV